jgi:hypothetical protein
MDPIRVSADNLVIVYPHRDFLFFYSLSYAEMYTVPRRQTTSIPRQYKLSSQHNVVKYQNKSGITN